MAPMYYKGDDLVGLLNEDDDHMVHIAHATHYVRIGSSSERRHAVAWDKDQAWNNDTLSEPTFFFEELSYSLLP
ncbi:hypothetical protein O988_07217 [Pseudogymnoascus sp. VKM F-3808]|nr:hypothetical protein O988_07217 [Pseudogymnoascus sp. VKM F-3808]